jgi:hypothetical protein
MQAGQTRIAREMEAFRAAQADPRTQSQVALDGAVEKLAHEPGFHVAVSDRSGRTRIEPTNQDVVATSTPN